MSFQVPFYIDFSSKKIKGIQIIQDKTLPVVLCLPESCLGLLP